MRKKVEKDNGITLIALVITIIIMLILVAATVYATFGGNGLIARTGEAKDRWGQEQENEMAYLNELDIDDLTGGSNPPVVPPDGLPVPDDFTYKEGTIEDGAVIVGLDESEFVWIPVPFPVLEIPLAQKGEEVAIKALIDAQVAIRKLSYGNTGRRRDEL